MAENGIDYGMTSQGFVPKRLAQILTDLNGNIADIVDPGTGEFPFQSATDDSILQQVLGVFAEGLSECWEAAYDGSVQFDPLKNSGAGQAGTIQLNAMLLKPGAYTIVEMELTGKNGTTVPKGSRVASRDGLQVFATLEPVFIGASGTVTVQAECTVKGSIEPEPDTILSIQTPQSGWLNARNTSTVAVGSVQETEAEARRRQQRSTSLTSYRQIEAIYAAVMNVAGVTFCRAYQNRETFPADARGIPFKEVAVVAEGGAPREIAQALFLRFPVGVIGHGNVHEVFYDNQGVSHVISFSRPTEIEIYVQVDVTIINRADFPDTGAELIKAAIVDYAEYGGAGNDDGFPPGASIICSRLYTPVNSIAGHKVTGLRIGTAAGTLTESDIPVEWDHVGRFDASRIVVNVTAGG